MVAAEPFVRVLLLLRPTPQKLHDAHRAASCLQPTSLQRHIRQPSAAQPGARLLHGPPMPFLASQKETRDQCRSSVKSLVPLRLQFFVLGYSPQLRCGNLLDVLGSTKADTVGSLALAPHCGVRKDEPKALLEYRRKQHAWCLLHI